MMIISTRKKGFIFIESIASIAILAGLLLPLLMLQGTIVKRVVKDKDYTTRSFILKNQFYFFSMNPEQEQQKSFETKKTNPTIDIQHTMQTQKENSILNRFTGLMLEAVKGSWTRPFQGEQDIEFSQLYFDPEQGEKNE